MFTLRQVHFGALSLTTLCATVIACGASTPTPAKGVAPVAAVDASTALDAARAPEPDAALVSVPASPSSPAPVPEFPTLPAGDVAGITMAHDAIYVWRGDGTVSTSATSETACKPLARRADLTNVVNISAGDEHSCALLRDGTVHCWGTNDVGQLGDGTSSRRAAAARVPELTAVRSLSTSGNGTCAVRTDGSLWCWGDTAASEKPTLQPTAVPGVSDARSVLLAQRDPCVVTTGGRVFCVGQKPRKVPDALTEATSLVGTGSHLCARLANGTVACWGTGFGNPSATGNVAGASVIVASADQETYDDGIRTETWTHSCAVVAEGAIHCWGSGTSQTGGVAVVRPLTPAVAVPKRAQVKQLALGFSFGVDMAACSWSAGARAVECWSVAGHAPPSCRALALPPSAP